MENQQSHCLFRFDDYNTEISSDFDSGNLSRAERQEDGKYLL